MDWSAAGTIDVTFELLTLVGPFAAFGSLRRRGDQS